MNVVIELAKTCLLMWASFCGGVISLVILIRLAQMTLDRARAAAIPGIDTQTRSTPPVPSQ